MFFQFIADYIKHRLIANNRHGTHSPFVYKLADEVIYDFSHKTEYKNIEALRKKLFNDDSGIELQDSGRFNLVKSGEKLQIKQLARKIMQKPFIDQLIYRLVSNTQPNQILEINANFGITSAYLAKANLNANIVAVEPEKSLRLVAEQNLDYLKVHHTTLVSEKFKEVLSTISSLDFGCFHQNYTKKVVLGYFQDCLPLVHEKSFLVFDGIYRNAEMKAAWTEIKGHSSVTVTIDLFWIGLVYFRKGQAKEHFKLKL